MGGTNFIPSDVLASRRLQSHLRRWLTIVAVSTGVAAIPFVLNELSRVESEELRDRERQLASQVAQTQKELTAAQAEAVLLAGRIERARALRTKRAWSSMLSMIGACLPPEAWLTSLATDPAAPGTSMAATIRPVGVKKGEAAPPAETVKIDAPTRLVLTGFAREHSHLYTFMTNLKTTGVFKEVKLDRSARELQGENAAIAFTLTCDWE
jgi:Tfp pilus assembly protein PilN